MSLESQAVSSRRAALAGCWAAAVRGATWNNTEGPQGKANPRGPWPAEHYAKNNIYIYIYMVIFLNILFWTLASLLIRFGVVWPWGGRKRVDASEISRNQSLSLFYQKEPSGPEMSFLIKKEKHYTVKTTLIWCLGFCLCGGQKRVDATEISRNQSLFYQTESPGPETKHKKNKSTCTHC